MVAIISGSFPNGALTQKELQSSDRGSFPDGVKVMGKVDEFLDEVMTTADVAEYLKMHAKTVARLAKNGKLPGAKICGEWRFKKSVIDSVLSGLSGTGVVNE